MEKNKKWGFFFTCTVPSVAEQAGLSLNWSQTPKTGFPVTWLIWSQARKTAHPEQEPEPRDQVDSILPATCESSFIIVQCFSFGRACR